MIRTLREWHAYIGLFIGPSVLFFTLTGAIQIFSLHEAHGKYQPAVLMEKLSAVHKDQVFEEPDHHAAPKEEVEAAPHGAAAGEAPHAYADEPPPKTSTLALKWFFLLVAIGLAISTILGLWMGTTQIRRKRIAWVLIIAGALVPIVLLAL